MCRIFKGFFSLYGNYIHIQLEHCYNDTHPETAFRIFQTKDLISLRFYLKEESSIYASPFSNGKKAGYYYLKSDPSTLVHIIDLPDLLVDILLIQAIHSLQVSIQLPIVQNIFEKYIQAYSALTNKLQQDSETSTLITSLVSKELLPYSCLFRDYKCQGKRFYHVGLSKSLSEKLAGLFCQVLEVYQDIQYENRYLNEISKTIATAYITKKNIPQNILKAMENTLFNKYFKYVEFDEEVDLNAVKKIENEFQTLNKAYFSGTAFFDVMLRFRKLGKHKASGLYYPTIHTLCVDLRSPSSFIHEYFHMLDDQMGDLSLGNAFQDIALKYKQDFFNNLNYLEPGVQTQLRGNGKYNLQYSFRRAEIFARCGEIYFVRILKVTSSLLEPDLSYAYPQTTQLDILIQDYYKDLLQIKLKQFDFIKAV